MPVFMMYSTILTELGIVVLDNQKCVKTFHFENPAEEYVLVKKGQAKLTEIGKVLTNDELVIVNDHGLLDILKKKSMDVQLMSNEQTDTIQSSKPKILVDSGFAKDENEAMEKLREFAMQLSSSKITEVSQSPDLHITQAINTLDEIGRAHV